MFPSGKDSAQETRNHSFCLHFTWNGLFSRSGSGNAVDHFFCFTFHHFLEEAILKASFELRFDQISIFVRSFRKHRVIIFPSNQSVFINFQKLFVLPRYNGQDFYRADESIGSNQSHRSFSPPPPLFLPRCTIFP